MYTKYFESLRKAKIIDLKSKKVLADLPSTPTQSKAPALQAAPSQSGPQTAQPAAPASGPTGYTPEMSKEPAFAFKMNNGYLVGRNLESKGQSPSPTDIHNCMKDKNVNMQRIPLSQLPHRSVISDVLHEDDPHVLHELDDEGRDTVLHAKIEKHPRSPDFKENNHVEPKHGKSPNYAFTNVKQMKVQRYGTPEGNLWTARAERDNGEIHHAIASTNDAARDMAYNKQSPGGVGNPGFMPSVGHENPQESDAHMVVGSHNYLRTQMPFFMMQQADHHLFHHMLPNGEHEAGVVSMSRIDPNAEPMYVHAKGKTGQEAIKNAIHQAVLEHTKHMDTENRPAPKADPKKTKRNQWLIHAIYRAPKKTLKDAMGENEFNQNRRLV